MAYHVQERKPDMFDFEYKGVTYSVPSVSSLPFKTFMRIRKKLNDSGDPNELFFDEVMSLFEEYAPEAMASMSFEEAQDVFTAYAQAGRDLGKSSTSSE